MKITQKLFWAHTLIILILAQGSCTFIAQKSERDQIQNTQVSPNSLPLKKTIAHIVFSHNLSGETHPCGCRNFPLGGLPQVYGKISELKKSGPIIYLDTGDTLFPSSKIPPSAQQSLTFAAENLFIGLDQMGLNYYTPGDQDLALGFIKTLEIAANSQQAVMLLSNIDKMKLLDHYRNHITQNNSQEHHLNHEKIVTFINERLKSYIKIQVEKSTLFFLGYFHPETLPENYRDPLLGEPGNYHLLNPIDHMAKNLEEIKRDAGYDEKNPHHRLIILSHSGMDLDISLAEKFKNIDWIIGSHTQNFLRYSRDVGQTKIVQVLSKNHYLGHITIDLLGQKSQDTYDLIEVRDELKDLVSPNPMVNFIESHKSQMNKLQIDEQNAMVKIQETQPTEQKKFQNIQSCKECHQKQWDFWSKTHHSIAYLTLLKSKEENNLNCIQCHSHGLQKEFGFQSGQDIFFSEHKNFKINHAQKELRQYIENLASVRSLNSKDVKVIRTKIDQWEKKNQITHNFSNVQCLNCHQTPFNHPFNSVSYNHKEKSHQMKTQCINCHTRDQSPEWYLKTQSDENQNLVDENVYQLKLGKVSCPKLEN